ncbi:MAG: ABC transporter permease [Solirubrobacterales bacterium]
MRRAGTLGRSLAWELTLPVILIAAWWLISEHDNSLYVPSLKSIVETMKTHEFISEVSSALVSSGKNFVAGMAIAILVGLVLGLILGSRRTFQRATFPFIELWRAAPPVVLLPLAMLFFGIGNEMKIVIIAIGALWPILLNTTDAVQGIEPTIFETARCYRLRPQDKLFRVILPAISPQVLAGIRVALSIGIALIVISELVGSTSGIGYYIIQAQRTFAYPQMWGATIVLGLVGYFVNLGFRGVERALLRGHGPAVLGEP